MLATCDESISAGVPMLAQVWGLLRLHMASASLSAVLSKSSGGTLGFPMTLVKNMS